MNTLNGCVYCGGHEAKAMDTIACFVLKFVPLECIQYTSGMRQCNAFVAWTHKMEGENHHFNQSAQ